MQRDRTSRQGSPASPGLRSVQSATENAAISLVDRRMNEDVALEPRMKPIQKLPTNGPMGVREPPCITTFVRVAPSAAKRRASLIRGPATPTSRAADEAGTQPAWSSVGDKLNSTRRHTSEIFAEASGFNSLRFKQRG